MFHRRCLVAGLAALLSSCGDGDGSVPGFPPAVASWGGAARPSAWTSTTAWATTHPRVFLTPDDVRRAQANIGRYPWARGYARYVMAQADLWLLREDEWLRNQVPGAGACFAYGFTGCPTCGASWGRWGGANCSFELPNSVTCANGHVLPDADHPDLGTGYVAPDGRIHYFVGSYNAWVVETLTYKALDFLALAYSFTGNPQYAAKASVILDALAAIYPTCTSGSWDYPSNPPSGRLNRPWFQVARVLASFVDQYDQIYADPSLELPSVAVGQTRRQNIETNLLRNGADYCYAEASTGNDRLTNGRADYLRGILAVGACLDLPEYVRYAVDSPLGIRSMLDNNLDRDGQYYETSHSYGEWTREIYATFAELLFNYGGSAYPEGLDLYRHLKFRKFLECHNLAAQCAGRIPPYGDHAPLTQRTMPPARPFDLRDSVYLERLYAREGDPAEQARLASLLRWFSSGNVQSLRETSPDKKWLIFHAGDVPAGDVPPPDLAIRVSRSDFFGQKGLGILRSGSGDSSQAVLMRFGPSLNHGDFDDLNINFFARGYEVTYDLGYGLGSTHTQVGWASQTAGHNVVVVDERSQGGGTNGTGGSLHLFADLPAAKVMEASSPLSYVDRGVTLYRRTVALIEPYAVDLFRVAGGSRHDYFFHALAGEAEFEGVALSPEEPGSLAGPEISWWSQQGNDGDIIGHPNQPYWNPPPYNGYGFLGRVRRGTTSTAWSAAWKIDSTTRVRMTMPASRDTQVVSAWAPGLDPTYPSARYAVVRRQGSSLRSQFAAIFEPYSTTPWVQGVVSLSLSGRVSPVPAIALKVDGVDGTKDYIYSSDDIQTRRSGGFTFAGRFLHARTQGGALQSLSMVGGREFSGYGWRVRPDRPIWSGSVDSIDPTESSFVTSAPLPTDGRLNGKTILIEGKKYSRTTAYRVKRIESSGASLRVFLEGDIVLGRGEVDSVVDARTLTSRIPHGFGESRTHADTRFFQGKVVQSVSGARTSILEVADEARTLRVGSTAGFGPGDEFAYFDIGSGDQFVILPTLSLTQITPTRYRLESETDAQVSPPAGQGIVVER